MQLRTRALTIVVSASVAATTSSALAATYQIGPGQLSGFAQLPALKPGDVVEVAGGASYGAVTLKNDGTKDQKITFRGVRVGGKRPVLSGGVNTLDIGASHVVIEGFDITGGSSRCVFHRADDVVLRDSVIHDCPAHGLLGADNGSGSLLMEYVEVHHCGLGDQKHQIYMATDEEAYPGAVFRMQFCYLHDGNGGHGVKSRAERNEIYYNWIEGSYYHELELIGPDPESGVDENKAREDSDVVGNVLRKTGLKPGFHAIRIGGDATGQTAGRYRFVNNTILMGPGTGSVFRVFDRVDTLEAYNNVIFRVGGGAVEIIRTTEAATPLPLVGGSNNWLPSGSKAPPEWTGTLTGADPAFVASATKDLHPGAASPLVDKGAMMLAGLSARLFPNPLPAPMFEPPPGAAIAVGTAVARAHTAAIDIGAYELGGAAPAVTPPETTPPPPSTPTPPPGDAGAPPTGGTTPGTTPPTVPPTGGDGTQPPSGSAPAAMGDAGAPKGVIPGVVGEPTDGSKRSARTAGCSLGGGRASGTWALAIALGLLFQWRRRRAR
jgi:hypothetical protein